jgi:hypothetical protein
VYQRPHGDPSGLSPGGTSDPLPPVKRVLLALSAAALAAAPAAASAAPEVIVPGVSYERIVRPGPEVVHVIRARLSSLVTLQPVLTAGTPSKRGTLTGAIRARLDQGAVAGMNGDYFNLSAAYPSGILMTAGELVDEPEPGRTALVMPPDGRFLAAALQLDGRYQAIDAAGITTFPVRTLGGANRPAERSSETIIYTPRFGPSTPTGGTRQDAVIALDPPGQPLVNAPLAGTVVATSRAGGSTLGPGQVAITGIGPAAANVAADLTLGRRLVLSLSVPAVPPGSQSAIGGGPLLVSGGVPSPILSLEGFTASQLNGRTSRSAVGQRGDGMVMLVTAEGPSQGSRGITAAEQAELMASLGAETAVGMDSGGSALLAVGDRLAIPWPSERPVTDALVVNYGGVQLPLPDSRLSPNGDGVGDRLDTVTRAPVPGRLTVTLARRGAASGRSIVALDTPGSGAVRVNPLALGLADGPYDLTALLTPADGSPPSTLVRRLVVDRTLGHLRLRKVAAGKGRTAVLASFRLSRAAGLSASVISPAGSVVKVLARRGFAPGAHAVAWDLRLRGAPAAAGRYTIRVEARTSLGRPRLEGGVTVPQSGAPAGGG